jgi:tryptophan 2,3-dioxygenase
MSEVGVDKAGRVKAFLDDAKDFLERGSKELKEAIKLNDTIRIRDAAEKLWNASISATNALILSYLDVVPASHWERRRLLERLEDLKPEIRRLGFRDRYGARERYLHEMTFYDGIIDVEMLEREVEKVREYVSDVAKAAKAH